MTTNLRTSLILLLAASSAAAQLSGPVLGYVLNPSNRTLLPLMGVPGSALAQAPLSGLPPLSNLAVSRGQDFAVATAAEDGRALLIDLAANTVRELPEAGAGADRVLISSSDTALAFYYAADSRVRVITGWNETIRTADVDLRLWPGSPLTMELADDGSLLVAIAGDGGNSLFRVHGAAAPTLLATGGKISSVAIARGAGEIAFTDSDANTVIRIAPSGEVSTLASAAQGIASPIAIAYSRDGQRVFVVNSANSTISILSAAGESLATLASLAAPQVLEPLRGNATFRLTPMSQGPLWALDADAREPRVIFIPVPPAARGSEGEADR